MPYVKSSLPILGDDGNPKTGVVIRAFRADNGEFLCETTSSAGDDSGSLVCHLPLNGLTGGNSVTDASGVSWSFVGGGVSTDFSVWKHGGSSIKCTYVNGSNVEAASATAWAFGTADFNIQFICRTAVLPTGAYFSPIGNWSADSGFCLFLRPDGIVDFRINNSAVVSSSFVFQNATYYFVDIRRVSGVCTIRLNGTEVASGSLTNSLTRNDFVRIGGNGVASDVWNGWVGNVRAVSGGVFGAATFSVAPPAPLLDAGHYEIWTPYSGEVFVVAMDDTAGTVYNHKILRTTTI